MASVTEWLWWSTCCYWCVSLLNQNHLINLWTMDVCNCWFLCECPSVDSILLQEYYNMWYYVPYHMPSNNRLLVCYAATLERDGSTSSDGRHSFRWQRRGRHCCCFLNCDSAWEQGDEFYSIRGAGWLRQICLLFLLLFIIGVCGCWCGCCVTCCYLCVNSSKLLTNCDDDWDCEEDCACCACFCYDDDWIRCYSIFYIWCQLLDCIFF